jgi:hypothetical protein
MALKTGAGPHPYALKAGVSEMQLFLYTFSNSLSDYHISNVLCRLCQPCNNRGNLVEYLVPALHLTAVFRAL